MDVYWKIGMNEIVAAAETGSRGLLELSYRTRAHESQALSMISSAPRGCEVLFLETFLVQASSFATFRTSA